MKKYISLALAALLVACALSACGKSTDAVLNVTQPEKLQIVATIFPEYDWVKEILGDRAEAAELTQLLDNGIDLHSFQPTAEDILKISTCDLFIYVGGESDEWVEDALREATNESRKVLNLLEILGDSVKEEEVVEGMEAEHDHDHEDGEADEHEEEAEYDEHVWLSLKNAQILCTAIADALSEIDPENKSVYQANVNAYNEKLFALDARYQKTVDDAARKTILFGDRFPFRYLADDYGLDYYAAFVGCSAETEASFQTITFLAGKVDELGLKTVLTIEKSDGKIAKTIVQNTQEKNQNILALNSMQSVTSADASAGVSYLSIMEDNLTVLTEALN